MLKIITNIKKLRKKSKPVDLKTGQSIYIKFRPILDEYDGRAIALATNQFGIYKRIIGTTRKYQNLFMLNPEIIQVHDKKTRGPEGCLSIPETMRNRIQVIRYKKIKVKYMDLEGNTRILKFYGIMGRAIQHAIDLLNGILIIDYKR